MKMSQKLAATVAITSLVLVGCGSSDDGGGGDDASPTTEAGGAETTASEGGGGGVDAVTIVDFAYDPTPIEVESGTAVTFTNEDSALHTATSEGDAPKEFDTGELAEGDSGEVTFDEPGTYAYFCEIHNYMTGEVEVK